MKKCFDNIKSLDMARMLNHHEATHMNSSEGEKVSFKSAVRLEGVVEVRTCTCSFEKRESCPGCISLPFLLCITDT